MSRRRTSVVIEADGGSRGNPGPAAYGAVLLDADTGEVHRRARRGIGVATNNVAEYSGLIAGLELYREHTPEADLEVRMDSKLVVEQMSGRWKIKHPDMKPLALGARALAPAGTTYTWVPREQNKHADRLANEALDGCASADRSRCATGVGPPASVADALRSPTPSRPRLVRRRAAPPTTLVLVRHGGHRHTVDKRFSGGLAGRNPGLTDEGRGAGAGHRRVAGAARRRDRRGRRSPVRRTRESAEILGRGARARRSASRTGFAEMEFGTWDGLTFAEVRERLPDDLDTWLGSLDHAPGGGESFRESRSGCWPVSTGCSRSTPAGRCSWSATSRRSRCWWPHASGRRWSRSTGWSWRRPR